MQDGWTATGLFLGKEAIYRIEKSPEGFYLFIFTDNMKILERDELSDTLEATIESALNDWGIAKSEWVKEVWEKSYSRPNSKSSISPTN